MVKEHVIAVIGAQILHLLFEVYGFFNHPVDKAITKFYEHYVYSFCLQRKIKCQILKMLN